MAHRDSGAWCDIKHVTTIWYVISTWIFLSHYILYGNSKSASLSARYRSSSSDVSQLMPQRTQGLVSPPIFSSKLYVSRSAKDICATTPPHLTNSAIAVSNHVLVNFPLTSLLWSCAFCCYTLMLSLTVEALHVLALNYLRRDKILNSKQKTVKRTVYGHRCWKKPKTRPSHVACTL